MHTLGHRLDISKRSTARTNRLAKQLLKQQKQDSRGRGDQPDRSQDRGKDRQSAGKSDLDARSSEDW